MNSKRFIYLGKSKRHALFKRETKISFYDCDPGGIIFYANIFRIAHSAYEDFLASLDLSENYFNSENYLLPIVHTECDYIKPIHSHEILTIELSVSKIGESSFELSYNFTNNENICKARLKTVHVSIDKKNFVKTNIPSELKQKLSYHRS